ncbi:MAG: 50S ribosomal protein L23 [Planctomycetota bacterium]
MSKSAHKVLVRPVLTEKAVEAGQQNNTYVFEVTRRSNKIDIRRAVERAFRVKVEKVRTVVKRGGRRRYGYKWITNSPVKRAYVTLVEGDRIDLL